MVERVQHSDERDYQQINSNNPNATPGWIIFIGLLTAGAMLLKRAADEWTVAHKRRRKSTSCVSGNKKGGEASFYQYLNSLVLWIGNN